jgi:hypothetical protein
VWWPSGHPNGERQQWRSTNLPNVSQVQQQDSNRTGQHHQGAYDTRNETGMKVRVVKLTPSDKSGTPESFEAQFEKRRKKGSGRAVQTQAPKLKPIQNKSFEELLQDHGIEEPS